MSGNVSKHVAVVHELSRIVETKGLLEASQLEQELACTEAQKEQLRQLTDIIRGDKITNMQRLRLVLLYVLRYEHDLQGIQQLKQMLTRSNISESQVGLVDQLLRYGGSTIRSGDLFQNKSIFAQARSAVVANFK